MTRAPQHVYQILTKRPERMCEFFRDVWGDRAPGNWWLGTSVENQPTADHRIPALLNTPATVRWISAEPLLGKIVLREENPDIGTFSWLEGFAGCDPEIPPLSWVVVGGESGPGARPMHPEWARSIRGECYAHGVPFFFKQWGEWAPHTDRLGGGLFLRSDGTLGNQGEYWGGRAAAMNRVGKKKAGRMLDGREWNDYPTFSSAASERRILEAVKQ